MRSKEISVDFCVIGGGMAGLSAAIAAARHGIRVALLNDRPVLGGNASSEIRMWICGAHGENNHETGIIEELLLENSWRNTCPSYSIWDSILYEKARYQENLELFLNTYVDKVSIISGNEIEFPLISTIEGNQMTTETRIKVNARLFADCTGDGMIGALAGAEFRMGREARDEFGESIAPAQADSRTMGLSCLIQARETDRLQKFIPPSWAYQYKTEADLPKREHTVSGDQNFWWLELGGMQDTIHDKEELRDELLKIAFGVWDHIKNHGDHGAERWALDWVGFLPGKRESRRFVGDYILNQNDVMREGRHFTDIVGYGGWTMDDHFPEGFYYNEAGTIWHPAPSPYGIPFRSLYSKNIANLLFAGRDISASHCALSSTRVQATCSTLGQAIGTAASIAVKSNLLPRDIANTKITDLQQILMEDDCYLPFNRRNINSLTASAELSSNTSNPELVRNGYDRQIGSDRNSWDGKVGDWIVFDFGRSISLNALRFVFDSNLSRTTHHMVSYYTMAQQDFYVPKELIRSFTIEAYIEECSGWIWKEIFHTLENHQRLVRISLDNISCSKIKITFLSTWGSPDARIFAIDCYGSTSGNAFIAH
jgi:hypothetical protein